MDSTSNSSQSAVKEDVATEKPSTTLSINCRPKILRPSALSGFGVSSRVAASSSRSTGDTSSKPAFKLKPSVLSSTSSISSSSGSSEPAAKKQKSDDEAQEEVSDSKAAEPSTEDISSSSREEPTAKEQESVPDISDVTSSSEAAAQEESSPVGSSDIGSSTPSVEPDSQKPTNSLNGAVGSSDASTSSKPSFIFGQNIQSKVMGVEDEVDSSSSRTNGESLSGNLFTGAADSVDQSSWVSAGKSLQESSKELTEREASQKRKYEEVDVVTGEESECNIIQMTCKLYSFDKDSWHERGRGTLRFNDKYDPQDKTVSYSRLVIRTQGTLTVMLNTKIWAGMTVEQVNDKSIRFTACDVGGQPKIYLMNGNPKDVNKLYNAMHYRLLEVRKKNESSPTKQ